MADEIHSWIKFLKQKTGLVLWRHMYVVSNTFFGHDMWRQRTFYVSPDFYAKAISWLLCVQRLDVKNRKNKVHSFLKQCMHDFQLDQFGGTFTQNFSWYQLRLGDIQWLRGHNFVFFYPYLSPCGHFYQKCEQK